MGKSTQKTVNYAGGQAYQTNDEYQLVTLALTSFVTDQYYRSADAGLEQLMALIDRIDPLFVAQTAVYARHTFGMRSITHAMAAMVSLRASGKPWAKAFYDKIVARPDDMLEIIAAYRAIGGGTLTNAMKRGFAAAFDRFDAYQIAKYRGEGKAIKLIDVVNLVHPVPTAQNAAALAGLVDGSLKNTETWEAMISHAGQDQPTAGVLSKRKAQIWRQLLKEEKLGYFALIRNLRNILNDAPEVVRLVTSQLTDPVRIKNSKVLPFRLLTAYKQLKGVDNASRQVLKALEKALDIACGNMPTFDKALVAIDNSGSMTQQIAGSKHMKCNEVGALFGIALAKAANADLVEFGTNARLLPYKLTTSALDFAGAFESNNKVGHGTNFSAIFQAIGKRRYERIFIFSDMQGWIGYDTPKAAFDRYKKATGAHPHVYSFDLTGYGTLQFPAHKVTTLAGFNPAIFRVLKKMEVGQKGLINTIRKVPLT